MAPRPAPTGQARKMQQNAPKMPRRPIIEQFRGHFLVLANKSFLLKMTERLQASRPVIMQISWLIAVCPSVLAKPPNTSTIQHGPKKQVSKPSQGELQIQGLVGIEHNALGSRGQLESEISTFAKTCPTCIRQLKLVLVLYVTQECFRAGNRASGPDFGRRPAEGQFSSFPDENPAEILSGIPISRPGALLRNIRYIRKSSRSTSENLTFLAHVYEVVWTLPGDRRATWLWASGAKAPAGA